jgi:hypothetical protein
VKKARQTRGFIVETQSVVSNLAESFLNLLSRGSTKFRGGIYIAHWIDLDANPKAA